MPFDPVFYQEEPKIVRQLRNVRERLSDEKRWCRYTRGKAEDGACVEANDKAAVAWCLHGAFEIEAGAARSEGERALARAVYEVLMPEMRQCCPAGVAFFNNESTHAQVIAALDRAIANELAKAKELQHAA